MTTGIITTAAGSSGGLYSGDAGQAINAGMTPVDVSVDTDRNVYIADLNCRIRKVSAGGIIATIAGNGETSYSGDGSVAISAQLYFPSRVAADGRGNVYVSDSENCRVRRISQKGIITTVAGNGLCGHSGDGGLATDAALQGTDGIAVDAYGNIYVSTHDRVRKISPAGVINTFAGNGTQGYSGDGNAAVSGQLSAPAGLAVDSNGNLYIADMGNSCIRKVSVDGIISTIAGTGKAGYSGDNGPARDAELSFPADVTVDVLGNIYIADTNNAVIRKISHGTITTVAGGGSSRVVMDGVPAVDQSFGCLGGVAVDSAGNIYASDCLNQLVRKVFTDGTISTIGGGPGMYSSPYSRYSGDDGPAVGAGIACSLGIFTCGLTVDLAGNVYLADSLNNAVRLLQPAGGISVRSVTNAASYSPGTVAPGEIVAVFGTGIGPAKLVLGDPSADGSFGTQLAGTSISFGDVAAPLIYVSSTQLAAVVPYELSGVGTVPVTVTYNGRTSSAAIVQLTSWAPGVFTVNASGMGQAAAVNQDGSINGSDHPAVAGDFVSLYATGEGQTSPPGVDGKLAAPPLAHPLAPVEVTVGGKAAAVQYSGGAPGEIAGVMQVNVQIPEGISAGSVPVVVKVGTGSSQPDVTITVR